MNILKSGLVIFFLISTNAFAFKTRSLKSNKRIISCLPANASTPGTSSSSNFGKEFGSCSGFSCNSGYTVSGSNCAVAAVYNVVCTDGQPMTNAFSVCTHSSSYMQTVRYAYNDGFMSWDLTRTLEFKWNCPSVVLTYTLASPYTNRPVISKDGTNPQSGYDMGATEGCTFVP